MVHVQVMGELMDHDHLDLAKTHPAAAVAAAEDELDDLAVVEVATDELAVGFVFFEAGDGEMVVLHDRQALRGDGAQEGVGMIVLCSKGGRTGQRFDEGDALVRVRRRRVVAAQDVDGHLRPSHAVKRSCADNNIIPGPPNLKNGECSMGLTKN